MKKIDSSGKLPTISFITISKYNSKELVDTINSLLDQINEENIEYIIVISERLSHEIKNMIFKKRESINLKLIECRDKGLYDAMNLGISSSTGKYLYFLNAGDLLIDKKLDTDIFVFLRDLLPLHLFLIFHFLFFLEICSTLIYLKILELNLFLTFQQFDF